MICGRGRKRVRNHSKNSFEALTPTFNDASRGGDVHRLASLGGGKTFQLFKGGGMQVFWTGVQDFLSATEFGLCPGEIEKLLKKIKPEPENRHLEVAKKMKTMKTGANKLAGVSHI